MTRILRVGGAQMGPIQKAETRDAAVARMLACARIGAVHSVVFAGFSPDALADRVLNGESTVMITADEGVRGGRRVPLKKNTDKALERCPDVKHVFVVDRTGAEIKIPGGKAPKFKAGKGLKDNVG